MTNRKNVDTLDICNEYLKDGSTVKSVAEIFNMHHDSIRKRLIKSDNEQVKYKMKVNSTISIKPNPSKIIDIDHNSFGIVPNNNIDSVHIFPIYLKEIMSNIGWNEDNYGYLGGNIGGKKSKAYLLVSGIPLSKDYEVDHIDVNNKNNMPNNLRIVTKSFNLHNRSLPKNNTSGYAGVAFNKHKRKWVASINIRNERHFLGLFDKKEDAALVRLGYKLNNVGNLTKLELEQLSELGGGVRVCV